MPARSDAIALIAIAAVIAAFDQLTKVAVRSMVGPNQGGGRLDLVEDILALEYTENRGAAFGFFEGLGPVLTLASVAVLIVLVLSYAGQVQPPVWQTVSTGLIAGGALGNLADRVRLGHVVDFVSVGAWPNFNVADTAITIGAGVWLLGWLRTEAESSAARVIDQEG